MRNIVGICELQPEVVLLKDVQIVKDLFQKMTAQRFFLQTERKNCKLISCIDIIRAQFDNNL